MADRCPVEETDTPRCRLALLKEPAFSKRIIQQVEDTQSHACECDLGEILRSEQSQKDETQVVVLSPVLVRESKILMLCEYYVQLGNAIFMRVKEKRKKRKKKKRKK